MPQVSIIVPVYKVEKYIHRCIDSILAQTFTDFELILVDDGSPDNCGAICDEYAAKDGRIKVIHKRNGGVSSARNAGMAVACGKRILFCDSDDYVASNWCEELCKCMDAAPNAFIVSNIWKVMDGIEKEYQPITQSIDKTDYFTIYKKGISANIFNKIYDLSLLRKHNIQFDEKRAIGEDTIFNSEYCALCNECVYIATPLYYYVNQKDSLTKKYDANMYALNIPLFWCRVPLIAEENLGEYCDIWVYYFQRMFGEVYDSRNKMSFIRKMQYCQRMLQSEEVQWCLNHADGKTENPLILRILKTKNYYLYWLVTKLAKLKKKLLKKG